MIKKELTEREPYHLFIRFDMNAEGATIEDARASIKSWVETNVVPKIQANTQTKMIKVLQPNEVFLPKLD